MNILFHHLSVKSLAVLGCYLNAPCHAIIRARDENGCDDAKRKKEEGEKK